MQCLFSKAMLLAMRITQRILVLEHKLNVQKCFNDSLMPSRRSFHVIWRRLLLLPFLLSLSLSGFFNPTLFGVPRHQSDTAHPSYEYRFVFFFSRSLSAILLSSLVPLFILDTCCSSFATWTQRGALLHDSDVLFQLDIQ